MDELHGGSVTEGLAQLSSAMAAQVTRAQRGMFDTLSDADVLAEIGELEMMLRRGTALQSHLTMQLERRGLPGRLVMSSTSALLQTLLRLSPYEAGRRVAAARATAPRVGMTGQVEQPLRPDLAAAMAAGEVSSEHARVILSALHQIPESISVAEVDLAEQELVAAAHTLPPREVGAAGRRILAYLNPDGVLTDDAEQRRLRAFHLLPQVDGSYLVRGRLTPTCGAALMAILMPHAAPRPATEVPDGTTVPDERSHPQRMHDAVEWLAGSALQHNDVLPSGAIAQIIVTVTDKQLRTGEGLAETSYGQLLPVAQVLQLADEADVAFVGMTARGVPLNLGRTRRIATRGQTLALIARDKGCSFPGCDRPPEQSQRHHVIPWLDGGPTDIGNLALLCTYDHREHLAAGWTCRMVDGLPAWIPPAWVDPEQRPRYNHRIAGRRHELTR